MPGLALYWWLMSLELNQQDGVQRAQTVMTFTLKGGGGRIEMHDNNVWYSSETLRATIACIPRGDDAIQVIVIAASQSGTETTRGVMEQLRDGMSHGGPFE